MPKNQKHEWHDTDGDERTYHRALHFGGRWQFFTQDPESKAWIEHENVEKDYLERLYEVLFNKYQRKRCAWKLVTSIGKLIGKDPTELR